MKNDRLIIIFLLIGLIAGVFLIRRNQYFRSLAQIPSTSGNVTLEIEKIAQSGDLYKIDIMVRTGSEAQKTEAVSTLATRIKVSSGSEIADSEGNKASSITAAPEFLQDKWEFTVNEITGNGDDSYINFAGSDIDYDGYSSSEFTRIATFYVKSKDPDTLISFDKELSRMYSKRRPITNIWDTTNLSSFRLGQ